MVFTDEMGGVRSSEGPWAERMHYLLSGPAQPSSVELFVDGAPVEVGDGPADALFAPRTRASSGASRREQAVEARFRPACTPLP